jgi:hypothetical protein
VPEKADLANLQALPTPGSTHGKARMSTGRRVRCARAPALLSWNQIRADRPPDGTPTKDEAPGRHLGASLNVGVTSGELEEIVIHTVPYAGFPTAINAMNLLREVVAARAEQSAEDELRTAEVA